MGGADLAADLTGVLRLSILLRSCTDWKRKHLIMQAYAR